MGGGRASDVGGGVRVMMQGAGGGGYDVGYDVGYKIGYDGRYDVGCRFKVMGLWDMDLR